MIYGTAWKKDRTAELVLQALRAGFRAVDVAAQPKHYREDLVGDALRTFLLDKEVKREELYVRDVFDIQVILMPELHAIESPFGAETNNYYFHHRCKPNLLQSLVRIKIIYRTILDLMFLSKSKCLSLPRSGTSGHDPRRFLSRKRISIV